MAPRADAWAVPFREATKKVSDAVFLRSAVCVRGCVSRRVPETRSGNARICPPGAPQPAEPRTVEDYTQRCSTAPSG